MLLLLVGICMLNFMISAYNAKVVGQIWAESKAVGGFVRVLAWAGAIQSAAGFTSVYAIIAGSLATMLGYFEVNDFNLFFSMQYLLIIIPVIGSGIIIMINSWINLYRERSLRNLGVAGWNTFAQSYNTYRAINGFGQALENVSVAFKNKGKKNANVVMLLVLVAALGILTTYGIVRKYAGTLDVPTEIIDSKETFREQKLREAGARA